MSDLKPADLVDQLLPDLTLTDVEGRPFPLHGLIGKPVTLFFFTHLRSPG